MHRNAVKNHYKTITDFGRLATVGILGHGNVREMLEIAARRVPKEDSVEALPRVMVCNGSRPLG